MIHRHCLIRRVAVEDPVVDAEEAVETEAGQEVSAESNDEPSEDIIPAEPEDPNTIGPASNLIDYSQLPPPNLIVPLSFDGNAQTVTVYVREDDEPAVIDFVREGDLTTELSIRLEEVGFTGNRSPWGTGQYALSNSGVIIFPVGQERGRVTLTMAPDEFREPDQQSTLRVREVEFADSELAVIDVILEDDDQRVFESRLATNTVAFARDQVTVRETDPAVQIDLVRFNPDDSPLVVGFTVHNVTATDGEDYFAPGSYEVSFGPRQRSARLLIPLVQDTDVEGDETFVVELDAAADGSSSAVNQRIAVLIRDDEPQPGE